MSSFPPHNLGWSLDVWHELSNSKSHKMEKNDLAGSNCFHAHSPRSEINTCHTACHEIHLNSLSNSCWGSYPTRPRAQLAALSVLDDIFLRPSLLFSSSGNYLSSGDIQASCKVSALAFILCAVLKLVKKRKYFISLIMPLLFQITPRKYQCQKYLGDCDWNENRAEEWAVLMKLSRIRTLASESS